MKVWIDGDIREASEARLPVLDHGLLYGDGVFEGIRVRSGCVFRLDAHLARFADSARAIGLAVPATRAQLEAIVVSVARSLDAKDLYLRLVATRGVGPLGVDPALCTSPALFCIGGRIDLYSEEATLRGLALSTASLRRDPAAAIDPRVKSLNYLGSVLAKREATLRGADEALLLNSHGAVAEAAVANLFAVRDGLLLTPPVSDGALEGITRDTLLRIAAERDIPYRVQSLGRQDLFRAEEVFLCGTGVALVRVRSLDGVEVGAGRSLFGRLEEAYLERATWDGVSIAA